MRASLLPLRRFGARGRPRHGRSSPTASYARVQDDTTEKHIRNDRMSVKINASTVVEVPVLDKHGNPLKDAEGNPVMAERYDWVMSENEFRI